MPQTLRYTRDQIMTDGPFARPHNAAGYPLHGGFAADGTYVSPRVTHRWPAVKAWAEALQARGWPLIDADGALLKRGNYPSAEQEHLLLDRGFGQFFWNSLTTTGIIEARGKALADFTPPDMTQIIADDIADSATGHLHLGLLAAHGMDEGGGDPRTPALGAHDFMWFAARDLAFGKDAYPLPPAPENISRPVTAERELPALPAPHEAMLKLLMNVLMIEVRAEAFFAFCCEVLRDPRNFRDRRSDAEQAAQLVERIRTDEAIHVAYLQVVVSELRSFTLKTVDGRPVQGAEILDPLWADMVDWHGRRERDAGKIRTREEIGRQVTAALGAEAPAFLARFDALDQDALAA